MLTRTFASGRTQSNWLKHIVWPCVHDFNNDSVCTKCSVMRCEWTVLLSSNQITTTK